MMDHQDYESIVSALRKSLGYAERVRVYRHLAPLLIADNENFDPLRFGVSLGVPERICRFVLTDHIKQEEVGNASNTQEGQHEEDNDCEEDDRKAVYS